MPIRVSDFLPGSDPATTRDLREKALSHEVLTMEGSRILAAASEARALKATGVEVCDLTVGDFAPEQFRAPESFLSDLASEVLAGRNQYPPSDGLPELQQAVMDFYERELNIRFPAKSVVICGGARPPIYGVFRALLKPGEKVVYPVPSWNNDYYTKLCGAECVPLPTSAGTNFMPTPDQVAEAISDPDVHLFCLNSPLNPCGTVISKEGLRSICDAIVSENMKRGPDRRPVYMLFDQVYWPLAFGEYKFYHPIELVPEIAPWAIYIDAISKWMVGTGLRLGWAVVPPHLYDPVRDLMGHIGGWAPRAVQASAAKFLADEPAYSQFRTELHEKLQLRLGMVYMFFKGMKSAGLPVEVVAPQGAIYTSVRFDVLGLSSPNGMTLKTNNDIRQYLLHEARVALVAFQAFGLTEDTGWFRISVGAVSTEALEAGLVRIRQAIDKLA